MNLKSGELLWPSLAPKPPDLPPLDRDLKIEVLVIGSGITGAFCAHVLSEAGIEVAVVDRREIGSGSTPASTAMVMYDIDFPLIELAKKIGLTNAQRAYRRSRRAVNEFATIAKSLGDSVNVATRPCLYLGVEASDEPLLREEVIARQRVGISAEFLNGLALKREFGLDRICAIKSAAEIEVDPYRLTLALLSDLSGNGAPLFPRTEVRVVDSDTSGVLLRTANGARITAKHVIFATGYETPEMLKGDYCKLKSTYALATQTLDPRLLPRQRPLIWEHRSPYFYARTTSDNRILCGGEDEDFSNPQRRDELLAAKTQTLLKRIKELMPWVEPVADFAWAGTFAETEDGLPIIGSIPELPHCHFALGYGGNGMTWSLIAAQVIRETITGRCDEDRDLFCFERLR
jgi:glycine/D-amino acid oxidase-like deaminating enzyme